MEETDMSTYAAEVRKKLHEKGYQLVLGSSSRFRRNVLERAGLEFECVSPDIDEKAIRYPDPAHLTLAIAKAKALAIKSKLQDCSNKIVICSDQVIVCNGVIREKPASAEEARLFLRSYRQHPAIAVDAVVVFNAHTGCQDEAVVSAVQHFDPNLPEDFIDSLIAQGDIFHCAGGFTVENMMQYTTKRIGEQSTIEGLPLRKTLEMIDSLLNET